MRREGRRVDVVKIDALGRQDEGLVGVEYDLVDALKVSVHGRSTLDGTDAEIVLPKEHVRKTIPLAQGVVKLSP